MRKEIKAITSLIANKVMANGKIIAEGIEEEILRNPKVMEVYLSAERRES